MLLDGGRSAPAARWPTKPTAARSRRSKGWPDRLGCIRSSKRSSTTRDPVRLLHARLILATKALLAENPHPTRAEIEACAGRKSLPLHRLLEHPGGGRGRRPPDGRSTRRGRDAQRRRLDVRLLHRRLATTCRGSTRARKRPAKRKYAGDLLRARHVYGRMLRSPYAHARIVGIDASRAEALPGVVAVLTGADVQRHRSATTATRSRTGR